ncbi:MAG TPA: hypothetical protein VKZ53_14670 [Candidatus Angelobacter sp.]|nr:hypothetical protein [Candidatus Angelobacter sp.]
MLKKILSLLLLVGLVGLVPAFSATPVPAPKPAAPAPAPRPEQHPHIRSAIRELQEAKHELETAAHDFGGHRKEALEAVDKAINQLKEALEYDKK